MRRKQPRRNWRWIAATQSEWCSVHNQIEMSDLESNGRFFPRNRLQSRNRTQDPETGKIFPQLLRQLLRNCDGAVGNDEALEIFSRTLQGDASCCCTTRRD